MFILLGLQVCDAHLFIVRDLRARERNRRIQRRGAPNRSGQAPSAEDAQRRLPEKQDKRRSPGRENLPETPHSPVFLQRVCRTLKRRGVHDFPGGRRAKRPRSCMKGRHLAVRRRMVEAEADERGGEFMLHVSMRVNICQEETKTED